MSEINQLDISLLDGYVDSLGSDVVQQMIDLYKQQSVIYLEEINAAIKEQSLNNWQERCHKMKGAAGSVGLISVHAKLVSIEKSTQPWPEKYSELTQLTEYNVSSITEFEQWLASK